MSLKPTLVQPVPGSTTIYLEDLIFEYDAVEITAETEGGLASTPGPRVLASKIAPGEDSK